MLKVNEYFEGKVKSIGFRAGVGSATVGVIEPGEYEFGTATVEQMRVVSGMLAARLPGEKGWKNYAAGESFMVEAGKKFQVRTDEDTAYLCLYQ